MAFPVAALAGLIPLLTQQQGGGGGGMRVTSGNIMDSLSPEAMQALQPQGPPQVNNQGGGKDPLGVGIGSRLAAIGDSMANQPMWETQLQPFSAPYSGPAVGPAGYNPGEAALLALMQRISAGGGF